MAATLDVISGGHLLLGMGASDFTQFFVPWGMPFPPPSERISHLREELDIIKLMWSEERADYEGRHYHLDQAVLNPKPLQTPRPEIWIGMSHGRRLMPAVAAQHGDGVNIVIGPDQECVERIEDVKAACSAIGRDADELVFSRHVLIHLTDESYDFKAAATAQARSLGKDDEFLKAFFSEDDLYHVRLIGNVDQVGEGLRKHLLDLGVHYPVIQFNSVDAPLGGDIDRIVADMETFATQIAADVVTPTPT